MSHSSKVDFRSLFESLPGMYYVLHPDFTIAAVSNLFLTETMTTREQLIGAHLFDIFPENPNDKDANGESSMRSSLKYVLEYKSSHTMAILKYDIRTPDGIYEERYWSPVNHPVLSDNQKVVYIIHQVKDVTDLMLLRNQTSKSYQLKEIATEHEAELYHRSQEIQAINTDLIREVADRKEAEEKAKAAQILLKATIESHKDILIFSIDRNYNYIVFNKAFQEGTYQVYGTRVTEGTNLLDSITNQEDRSKAKANCDQALSGESFVTIEEYGELHRYYYETRYTPILDEHQKIVGVTVQSANITDRKLAEQQIRALNEELESFTYSVAHDLRAPLRAINGYSAILTDDYNSIIDQEGKRLLHVIMNNAKMMGKLIDDLLDFSRMGKLSVQHHPVDMNQLLSGIIANNFADLREKNIDLNINTLDPVHCDSSMIRQVFINLLSNAIKYSRNRNKPQITIGSNKQETEVVYFIRDNGVGFDMKYAKKLFGVFTRLHKTSEFEGTGVGLALVHRIISKHGGRIWAEGEIDKGATFYFSLPTNTEN
jgi:PAS domain S-box-containing protein